MRIDVIVNITGSCPVNKGANPLSALLLLYTFSSIRRKKRFFFSRCINILKGYSLIGKASCS